MNLWNYLKYVVGVAMVVVGIYWMATGNFEQGWELILAGLALLGIYLGLDVHAYNMKVIINRKRL